MPPNNTHMVTPYLNVRDFWPYFHSSISWSPIGGGGSGGLKCDHEILEQPLMLCRWFIIYSKCPQEPLWFVGFCMHTAVSCTCWMLLCRWFIIYSICLRGTLWFVAFCMHAARCLLCLPDSVVQLWFIRYSKCPREPLWFVTLRMLAAWSLLLAGCCCAGGLSDIVYAFLRPCDLSLSTCSLLCLLDIVKACGSPCGLPLQLSEH